MSEEVIASVTEKLVRSINRINKDLFEVSEKTILSGPNVKDISRDSKELWLKEQEVIEIFRNSFEKYKVDEKRKNMNICDITQGEKMRVTVPQKLAEQKTALQNEIRKLKEEQSLLETDILKNIASLNMNFVENEQEEPKIST